MTTKRRKKTAAQKSNDRKRKRIHYLTQQVRELSGQAAALRDEIEKTVEQNSHIRTWHASQLDVSLIASGEPGLLHVTCTLKTPTITFSRSKDFHVVNICQSLPYTTPITMKVWRENLAIACDVLDKAISKSEQ